MQVPKIILKRTSGGVQPSFVWLGVGVAWLLLLVAGVAWSAINITKPGSNCLSADGTYDVCYCEAFSPGIFKEVHNTLSALAFSVVGLVIAFSFAMTPPQGINRFTNGMFFPAFYMMLAIFLGPGSMMFHASLTTLGGFFDTFSMYNWLSFIIGYDVVRILNVTAYQELVTTLLYVGIVTCFTVAQQFSGGGNAVFAALVILALVTEGVVAYVYRSVVTWNTYKWFIGGLAVFLTAFLIWNLSWTGGILCFPHFWLQGHAVWHSLCAVTVGMLYVYFRISPEPTTQTRKSHGLPLPNSQV